MSRSPEAENQNAEQNQSYAEQGVPEYLLVNPSHTLIHEADPNEPASGDRPVSEQVDHTVAITRIVSGKADFRLTTREKLTSEGEPAEGLLKRPGFLAKVLKLKVSPVEVLATELAVHKESATTLLARRAPKYELRPVGRKQQRARRRIEKKNREASELVRDNLAIGGGRLAEVDDRTVADMDHKAAKTVSKSRRRFLENAEEIEEIDHRLLRQARGEDITSRKLEAQIFPLK